MTHSYVRHDSLICETWLIDMWDMTHSSVCQDQASHDVKMESHTPPLANAARSQKKKNQGQWLGKLQDQWLTLPSVETRYIETLYMRANGDLCDWVDISLGKLEDRWQTRHTCFKFSRKCSKSFSHKCLVCFAVVSSLANVVVCECRGEVGGWGRDPKKCRGSIWGMGSSTI